MHYHAQQMNFGSPGNQNQQTLKTNSPSASTPPAPLHVHPSRMKSVMQIPHFSIRIQFCLTPKCTLKTIKDEFCSKGGSAQFLEQYRSASSICSSTGLEDLTDVQWDGGLQDFTLFAWSTIHKCLPGGLIDSLLKTALRATQYPLCQQKAARGSERARLLPRSLQQKSRERKPVAPGLQV